MARVGPSGEVVNGHAGQVGLLHIIDLPSASLQFFAGVADQQHRKGQAHIEITDEEPDRVVHCSRLTDLGIDVALRGGEGDLVTVVDELVAQAVAFLEIDPQAVGPCQQQAPPLGELDLLAVRLDRVIAALDRDAEAGLAGQEVGHAQQDVHGLIRFGLDAARREGHQGDQRQTTQKPGDWRMLRMLIHTASHVPLQGMATGPREATCFTVVRSGQCVGQAGARHRLRPSCRVVASQSPGSTIIRLRSAPIRRECVFGGEVG